MTSPVIEICARPGAPLGSERHRERAVGRIGGVIGFPAEAAAAGSAALESALGAGARILRAGDRLTALPIVVDFDACSLDGVPLVDLDGWRRVAAADRWGEVRGAFVGAWIDPDGALHLVRDPIGERTLFYAVVGNGITWTSGSIRALLSTGLVARRIDRRSVAVYLAYAYVPGESTLIDGVKELLPGEHLRFSDGTISRRAIWVLPAEPGDEAMADEDALRRNLRAQLETAVARRLPRGEPVGAFLSGGLDSSLVVALARRLHDSPVHTWSIHFGPGSANELAWSSMVSAHCGTEHRIVELTPEAIVGHLDQAIAFLSDPIGDPLTVPNALLFRQAASEVGVILNGEGGDPCFGGPKNLPMVLAELYGHGPLEADADERLARERSYLRAHQKCYDDLPSMLEPDLLAALVRGPLEASLEPFFTDPRFRHFVTKLQAINVRFKGAHHILPKVDAESAPFGVVARSPLFDRDVVEAAFGLAPQQKLRGSIEKYLLKRAVEDVLPPEIIDRPKSGMLVPVEAWFQGPLLAVARERLLDGLAPAGLVRREWIERLLSGRLGGLRPRRGAKIWLLITLESWLRGVAGDWA